MALKAGRVGVAPDQVDDFGQIKSEATSGYTKQEADAKFETLANAALLQPKTMALPIQMLEGSQLVTKSTVEDVIQTMDNALTNIELTAMVEDAVLREHTYTGTSDANGVVVASTVSHRPIVYCYGAPEGGGNVYVEARPGGGGIAFYCHNNGTKVASTEITIHYFDYQD